MLGIDKDHSQNSASLDGTNVFFTLVKCVLYNPKSNNKAIRTIVQRESVTAPYVLSHWNSLLNGKLIWILKNPRKIHFFWRGSPDKIRIAGAKYHVIGFASTRGHEKQPATTDFKVAQF